MNEKTPNSTTDSSRCQHPRGIYAIYELPFFKDHSLLRGKLLGGWTINAVSQFYTGTPFSVTGGGAAILPASAREAAHSTGTSTAIPNWTGNSPQASGSGLRPLHSLRPGLSPARMFVISSTTRTPRITI